MSTGTTRWLLAALWLCLAWAGPAPAQDSDPTLEDPRVGQAGALLGSPEGYDSAIRLYREVLAEVPASVEVRLRLARVLAWSQRLDEAITEYDRILAAHPDRVDARIERAEVLSWQGALDRARLELEHVLEVDPRNARATRGLARTHRWAGRSLAAARAYARALELEEDPALRQEWEELRSAHAPEAGLRLRSVSDSDDFRRREGYVTLSRSPDLATRIEARLGVIRVEHPRERADARVRPSYDRDRAEELQVIVERQLDDRIRAAALAGVRDWHRSSDRPWGRLRLELAPDAGMSLAFELERADPLDLTDSFEALTEGIRHTTLRGSVWRGFTPRVELWAAFETSRVTDGNTRGAANASLSYRWRDLHGMGLQHEVIASVMGNVLSYSDASPAYYDPELDLGLAVSLEHEMRASDSIRLRYGGGWGRGRTRDRTATESGSIGHFRASLQAQRGPWRAGLEAATYFSQRSNRYRSKIVELRVLRSF